MDPDSQTNDAKILSLLPAEKIVPVSDWSVEFVDLLCAASFQVVAPGLCAELPGSFSEAAVPLAFKSRPPNTSIGFDVPWFNYG